MTVGSESNLEFWWEATERMTRPDSMRRACTWDPVLAFATYSGLSRMLRGPIVQADVSAEDAPLNPNYIKLLLDTTDLQTLRNRRRSPPRLRADCCTRCCGMRCCCAYWNAGALAAIRHQRRSGVLPRGIGNLRCPATVDGVERIERACAGISTQPLWHFLRALQSLPTDPNVAACVAPLLELRESLRICRRRAPRDCSGCAPRRSISRRIGSTPGSRRSRPGG